MTHPPDRDGRGHDGPDSRSPPLAASGVVAGYGASEHVLKGVSLTVGHGEIVAVIGPNGAGKSTFLKAVAGLVRVSAGRIVAGGQDVTTRDARGRARAGISFVPQERNVFPRLTVAENLAVSSFLDRATARQRRNAMYERYPMLAEKRRAQARTLSGGQRQILAMAMGLMVQPALLLLDEPTAGLSPKAADDLFEAVLAINRDGVPVLMVEQHAMEALQIATRGYVLVGGSNGAEGPGAALAGDPAIRRLFLGG